MKNTLYLLLLLCGLIASCSNEDNPESNNFPEKVYEGSVFLTSQVEVNEFGSNNYTKIFGDLTILSNSNSLSIKDLTPLSSLHYISKNLNISNNDELETITGFHNIDTIGASLKVYNNEQLSTLDFENLQVVGSGVLIEKSKSLKDINQLRNLTTVGATFDMRNNDVLENINGINGFYSVERIFFVNNPHLSNFCVLQPYLNNSNDVFVLIADNGYNPTKEEIKNGNCSP